MTGLMTEQERADYIEPKIAAALALLDSAVRQYKPKMVVGLMSGGDDSIPACYVASLHPQFSGILHVNTGIGIEATREHVRKICAEGGWRLWEYEAGDVYERFVERLGFPSPSMHGQMYHLLKKDQIMRFERDHGLRGDAGKLVVYAAGRRRQWNPTVAEW